MQEPTGHLMAGHRRLRAGNDRRTWMSRRFDGYVLTPHKLSLIWERRNTVHGAHWRQSGMIIVRLSGRWPTQHRTHRMRSRPLLLQRLLLMHLHQLLLLLLVEPHQFLLVPVRLDLVRIQIQDLRLLLRLLLHLRLHRLTAIVVEARLVLLLLARLRRGRVQLLLTRLLGAATQLLVLMLPGIATGRSRVVRPYVFTQLIRVFVHRATLVALKWRASRAGGTNRARSLRRKVLLMLVRMIARVTTTATTTTAIVLILF